ncbi:MAG: hypothetical protein ACI4JT_07360 [Oscillospiraceae bacterium]
MYCINDQADGIVNGSAGTEIRIYFYVAEWDLPKEDLLRYENCPIKI